MAAVAETINTIAADAEKVMAVLPDFQYSEDTLAKEETVEEIRCQLKGMSTETTEAKATIQTEMDGARQHLQLAEEALEQKKESDRQTYAQLSAKVDALIEAQVELQAAQDEKKKVELEHHDDILLGDELREAKSKNVAINEGAFCSLLNGSWTSAEDRKEKIATLKEYLQEIGTEKTLVAAAEGLITKPEVRGDFDKMAIDCITEELSAKLKQVEEKLSERAPTEREVRAELLGLEALLDICQQKASSAEEQHKQVEVTVKGSKTEMKTCKQQVAKYSKELEALTAKMETQENKAQSLEQASAALERLVGTAKAAVEKAAMEKAAAEKAAAEKAAAERAAAEKAAAEKAAAEKAAAEKAEAEAKAEAEKAAQPTMEVPTVTEAVMEPEVAEKDMEPPAKRMRTEEIVDEPAKEAKLEAQVASPARVRVSIG